MTLTPTTTSQPSTRERLERGVAERLGAAMIVVAAVVAGAVLVLDVLPAWLTGPWHPARSAAPLAATALGVAVRQLGTGAASRLALARAALLAAGFLSWSASQVVPSGGPATACNDAAILLFVVDVALGLVPAPRE